MLKLSAPVSELKPKSVRFVDGHGEEEEAEQGKWSVSCVVLLHLLPT